MNNSEKKVMDITTQRINELKGKESQESFAAKIHMSQANVSKMLNGNPPSAATLKALAEIYDVSVDWLLGLSDRKSRKSIPSAEEMTYADAIAVIDKLFRIKAIRTGYVYNGEYHDPSSIEVCDGILKHILETRHSIDGNEEYLLEAWYKVTAERYAEAKVVEWTQEKRTAFRMLAGTEPTDQDILRVLPGLLAGRRLVQNENGSVGFEEEMPF